MPDRSDGWPLFVEVHRSDPALAATVKVRGEIDLATAPALQQRLGTLLDEGVEALVLDLSAVSFCDVTGLNLLLWVQSRLWSRGGQLTVLRPCPSLRIMAAALGLADSLHLAPAPGTEQAERADRNRAGTALIEWAEPGVDGQE